MGNIPEQLLILITTPIYVFVIGLEIALSHFRRLPRYTVRGTLYNLYLMLLNSGVDLLFRGVYVVILTYFYELHLLRFEHGPLYWGALVIAEDFLYYWLHRVDHHSRFFWAVHVTHHSAEEFNLTVGFRSSVFQPLYRFIYFIPLALAGFSPIDIMLVFSATQIWGILVHTEYIDKMGWLEYILVTPSHHRVHHASNVRYLDRNLGMLLIIWDKLFGTFEPEAVDYQPIRYGLTKPMEKWGPGKIVFHEWQAIGQDVRQKLSWRDRLRYIFGPPGWSHDGSRQTSDELREMEQDGQQSTTI